MKPLIVINLKTYKTGKSLIKLVKAIEKVDKNIIIGASACDISELSKKTKLTLRAVVELFICKKVVSHDIFMSP